ncbi:response regulator transcription factor [Leisingera caerulea]|uniref:Response regulator transcription factor n=1 Tax=Leisingera caerulea TaxID=506591 RepID=A0A9Q9HLB2_LEICA|nr:response regulator transcription factor [Leisingera caerulea]UWQ51917.1 response regulator transcription factor [Leisingera caerulea]UWQ56486.1 response regulator transcription factor [Leisingera caerulea]UWQ86155.1 response regulator transcription factor [Leisingera caerulea]
MPVHIVGESRLLRDMFLNICEAHDYETGSCCSSLAELPPLPPKDLVLFYSHCTGAGLEAELRSFRARKGGAHLILVTGDDCPPEAQARLSTYAEAVIPERQSADALIAALQVVQNGYRIVLPEAAAAAAAEAPPRPAVVPRPPARAGHGLSDREQLILAKLTEGATNKSIANELGICEATVKVHLRTCFRKIGAKNRTQAALWASERLPPQTAEPRPH